MSVASRKQSGEDSDDDDDDEEDDDNEEEDLMGNIFDRLSMGESLSSVTIPGHIVARKDHATNERLTVRLNLPSGCGPSDIDAKISPCGREVVVNYLWPAGCHDEADDTS